MLELKVEEGKRKRGKWRRLNLVDFRIVRCGARKKEDGEEGEAKNSCLKPPQVVFKVMV